MAQLHVVCTRVYFGKLPFYPIYIFFYVKEARDLECQLSSMNRMDRKGRKGIWIYFAFSGWSEDIYISLFI